MVKNQKGLFLFSDPNDRKTLKVPADQRFFKVPVDQRKANPDAYEPYLFSFGLYHAVIPSATDAIIEDDGAELAESVLGPAPVQVSNGDNCNAPALIRDEGAGIDAAARVDRSAAESKAYRDACNQFQCNADDGDHFKLLFAKALLSEDALSALVGLIQKHDAKVRKLYIQMPLVKLKAISASSLAVRLMLDSITIVAAALDPFKSNEALMIYPIARLSFSDAILLENQVPIFVHSMVIDALPRPLSHIFVDHASESHYLQQLLLKVLEWYRERASPFPNFTCAKPPDVDPYSTKPLLHYIYKYLTEAEADPRELELELENPKYYTPRADQGSNFAPASTSTEIWVQPEENYGSSWRKRKLDPLLPSASYLVKCGVKFRACDAGFRGIRISESWMGVELSIPQIAVSDNIVRSLHNLLAYEATTRYPAESFVISFVHFMDRLIDTQEDVQVLVDAHVIRNFLGSHEELASMWNKLCISVSCRMTKNDRAIMAKLEALAQKRWRKWWASYTEKYWKKQPWLIASILGAVFLLVLTFLQTIYTMEGRSTTN